MINEHPFQETPNHHIYHKKHYLANLPEILEPFQPYDDSSTDLVIVYPIFRPRDGYSAKYLLDCYVKSSVWGRYSWLRNSDVIQRGISVKLYMESELYDDPEVRAFLDRQGVTESDVIVNDHIQDFQLLSRKLHILLDERLDEWKYRLIVDADALLARIPEHAGDQQYSVEPFLEAPKDFGVVWFYEDQTKPHESWVNTTEQFDGAVAVLSEKYGVNFYPSPDNPIPHLWDCLMLVSTEYCQQERFREFIASAAPLLGQDEMVLGLWKHLEPSFYELLSYPGRQGLIDLPIVPNVYDMVTAREQGHPFYISHIADHWEVDWRTHIGVE